MSKELNFGDGYDEVKYHDNSTNFDLVLTTNGAAFNLTQADEITVKIANDSGYIMSKDIDPSTITNPENGEFFLPVDDSIMSVLVPDDYYIEVWLKVNPVTPVTDDQSVTLTVDNDSLEEHQSIFPSTGLIGFTIDENINNDTGEVIPVITFDQFNDQFNDIMEQMRNTVSNAKKYVIDTDLNNGLSTKVTDNKNGTIEVNGSSITPADDSKVTHNSSDDAIIYGNNNVFHLGTQLSSKDDISKLTNIGWYRATKVAPANNPLGTGNQISGDCISLWWSWVFVDNNGEVYVLTPNNHKWDRKVSENGTNNFHGANNFDTVPTVNNNPLLLASSLPSDLARTGQANTFSSLQTFSQGVKTLQTGSYDDANSLVNEGLYYNTNSSIKNGAGSLTTGYIQVMSGYGKIVRQIMYSDTNGGVMYDRTSQNGGSSWSDWVQIVTWDQTPSDYVQTDTPQTFTAQQTFSIAPIDKKTGNPYITKDGVPSLPSDLARTGQANTFSSLQTFSQGVKTLQTGSYSDANSLVNEGLYYNTNSSIQNGAPSITTGYIQVMSGGGEIVRQIMYSDTDAGLIYDRVSQNGGSSWGNWIEIAAYDQMPTDVALTDQDSNFTRKLQKSGVDVATTTDVNKAVNTATANMVDTTKPANFTAGLQKGGIDVATAADLKSVEKSAWRRLDNKYITNSADGKSFQEANENSAVLYQINEETKYIAFLFIIFTPTINAVSVRIDFSSIVKNIFFPSDYTFSLSSITSDNKTFQMSIVNNQIQTGDTPNSNYICSIASSLQEKSSSEHEAGQCFICYDELV